jgi:hypothetical protein
MLPDFVTYCAGVSVSEMKEMMVNAHVIECYIRKVATNVADNNAFI